MAIAYSSIVRHNNRQNDIDKNPCACHENGNNEQCPHHGWVNVKVVGQTTAYSK